MKYVLIADDNKDITDILAVYVRKEGYEPLVAKNGIEAEHMFEDFAPVAILLDVMMPLKDGYEVCKEIRKRSSVPIILITARGEDFDKIMGLDIGADDYIVKPFSPSYGASAGSSPPSAEAGGDKGYCKCPAGWESGS